MKGNHVYIGVLSAVMMLAVDWMPAMEMDVWAAARDEIIILYTNDVHCGVDDNIGYAGLALYEQQVSEETPYVTLVDAGDAIQGAPIGTLSDGGYLIDIMNELNYDIAIPGNHEFDFGMKRFLKLSEELECGYISSNFMDLRTGETVFEPYRMITYGDTDVAYVGVTTPESFTKSTPTYFQDDTGSYIYSFCEDEDGSALYEQVQNTVDMAREDGADYVILVAHLGVNDVMEHWSSVALLENTTGIDACIDGHSHEVIPEMLVKNQSGEDVVLTQTGTKLAAIGQMTIGVDGQIETQLIERVEAADEEQEYVIRQGDTLSRLAKRELSSYNRWPEIYERNKDLIQDPDLLEIGTRLTIPRSSIVNEDGQALDYKTDCFIKNIQSQYSQSLKVVLGRADCLLTVADPATGERKVRSAETNLGDWTADAYRIILGADIGFSNGGGIRADIQPGPVTYETILTVFPFGNMGCVVEAAGQQIKDALEMAVRGCPEEDGGFQQVSGITFTVDTSIPSSVKLDEKGNFIRVDGEYRVKDIMVGGKPLELENIYTVASHNYLLKSSGGGMTMFEGCNLLKDEVMVDSDILSAYLKLCGGVVPKEYAACEGQGRIVIE